MAEFRQAPCGGFRKMFSFGFTCLVYHATTTFCKRVYPWQDDPLGKTSGQMIGAARSARQNIVEASARAGTSRDTELKLLDVAKASLAELQGDYEAFLIDRRKEIWSIHDPLRKALDLIQLDKFVLTEDDLHEFSLHIIKMRERFAPWLENEDPVIVANSLIVIIDKAKRFLYGQMQSTKKGNLPATDSHIDISAPKCPLCGGEMQKRIAKSGNLKGKPFWGCSAFPKCKGFLEIKD